MHLQPLQLGRSLVAVVATSLLLPFAPVAALGTAPGTYASVSLAAPKNSPASHRETTSSTSFSDFLESVEQFLKIIAYCVGAGWVIFNYLKGRTHRNRLELKVSGECSASATRDLFCARVQVKNVGLSKVQLGRSGSVYEVYGLRTVLAQKRQVLQFSDEWLLLDSGRALTENHTWIEPSVAIEQPVLVTAEIDAYTAFKVQVFLVSEDQTVEWRTTSITLTKRKEKT